MGSSLVKKGLANAYNEVPRHNVLCSVMTRMSGIGEDKGRDRALPRDPLLKSEEWLRLAAEGAQMGLWYWNEVTNELFWDKKTREMFGVNLVGNVTVDTFYRALHPDDL